MAEKKTREKKGAEKAAHPEIGQVVYLSDVIGEVKVMQTKKGGEYKWIGAASRQPAKRTGKGKYSTGLRQDGIKGPILNPAYPLTEKQVQELKSALGVSSKSQTKEALEKEAATLHSQLVPSYSETTAFALGRHLNALAHKGRVLRPAGITNSTIVELKVLDLNSGKPTGETIRIPIATS